MNNQLNQTLLFQLLLLPNKLLSLLLHQPNPLLLFDLLLSQLIQTKYILNKLIIPIIFYNLQCQFFFLFLIILLKLCEISFADAHYVLLQAFW